VCCPSRFRRSGKELQYHSFVQASRVSILHTLFSQVFNFEQTHRLNWCFYHEVGQRIMNDGGAVNRAVIQAGEADEDFLLGFLLER